MKKLDNKAIRTLLRATTFMLLAIIIGSSSVLPAQEAALSTPKSDPDLSSVRTTPAPANNGSPYLVGIDDVLAISVWHEPDLSRSVSVRPDGKISLPLIGEVQASGKSVLQLQEEIRGDLAAFVKDPEVVVIVSEIRSQRINVIGQVTRAGTFPLTQSMGVIDAIALAGGLREYAKPNQIYVLRISPNGQRQRISYNYSKVLKGAAGAKEITLEPRDTVVVP